MTRKVSVGRNLTTTDKTTIYTVPPRNNAYWDLFYAINNGANNKYVSLFWYDASENVEIEILNQYTLNAKNFLKFDGGAVVVLDQDDQIRVQIESSANMSVIATFDVFPELSVKRNS